MEDGSTRDTERILSRLRLASVRQAARAPALDDVKGAVAKAIAESGVLGRMRPGARVAVTAGSRGIADIATVLRTVCDGVRRAGGQPFIFPAMGSHGGATAEGQVALLESLGVTEASVGAPVRATMEVVELGRTEEGLPVYLDRYATEADAIIAVNRVKSHSDFSSTYESGLMKILAVGAGKRMGAEVIHSGGAGGLRNFIVPYARQVIAHAPVIGGLALLENERHSLAEVVGLPADEIEKHEAALLVRAKAMEPSLPFDEIDLLIIDRMGKEISGVGMDTNVIGRRAIRGEPDPERPKVAYVFVRTLTPASHGNAIGVGLADFTTMRLAEQIDWPVTRLNGLISGFLERAKLPLTLPNDRAALLAALTALGAKAEAARVVRIRDTADLTEMAVSESLLGEARARDLVECGPPQPMAFDSEGWMS